MRNGPAVRRRRLGEELRRLRRAAGLTSDEAARLLGWHQLKVSRIETGVSGVKEGDLPRPLDALGVADSRLRTLLGTLAGAAGGGQGWWQAYGGVIPPQYRDFISLESQARTARTLETSVMPGLLQTPDYARAVTRAALDGPSATTVGLSGGGTARPPGGSARTGSAGAARRARRGRPTARRRQRTRGDARISCDHLARVSPTTARTNCS